MNKPLARDLRVSPQQAATETGLPAYTIRRLIRAQVIPAVKFGGRWRLTNETLNDLVSAVQELEEAHAESPLLGYL